MDQPDAPSAGGRIEGWIDFTDRVRATLAMGVSERVDWCLSDPDFSRWPLGERGITEALQQWVLNHPGGRMTLLAARFDELPRRHPRWLNWRRDWSHRVTCREAAPEEAGRVRAMLLWPGRVGLRLLDEVSGRGQWTTDPGVLHNWLAEYDVILQRSSEAMPSTTLGL